MNFCEFIVVCVLCVKIHYLKLSTRELWSIELNLFIYLFFFTELFIGCVIALSIYNVYLKNVSYYKILYWTIILGFFAGLTVEHSIFLFLFYCVICFLLFYLF